jgi:Uma2 family endonuclease
MPVTRARRARLYLRPELAGALLEPEEFDTAEQFDDTYRYELIYGVLVVSPYPLPTERGPNEMLGHWLLTYREQHPQGAALDLTLHEQEIRTRENRRRADRAIWAGLGRLPNVEEDTPTIVVEFVSAARKDRQRDYDEKRKEYLEMQIAEYWIIDRFRRLMTVYRHTGQEVIVKENELYTTPLLPGFELSLARLLQVADALQRPRRKRPT